GGRGLRHRVCWIRSAAFGPRPSERNEFHGPRRSRAFAFARDNADPAGVDFAAFGGAALGTSAGVATGARESGAGAGTDAGARLHDHRGSLTVRSQSCAAANSSNRLPAISETCS